MTSARNHLIAEGLREAADRLADEEASPYRVAAYRRAAAAVEELDEDVATLVHAHGEKALCERLAVDEALAAAIAELARSGRLALLDRLRGTLAAEALFASLPGIGPRLARDIYDSLRVDTLEALELAAWDGRLATVPGVGPRRIAALRLALGQRLRGVRARVAADRVCERG